MTVANVGDFETGLEDFDMEDAVIPRLTIVHKEGLFKDSLSGETFPDLRLIILGLVKQRILWHMTVDDNDRPMCRSNNHEIGFPNMREEQPKNKRFPWAESGFDINDFPADENGNRRLPCASCRLKEWETHPNGKTPYCSEQFTLPVLYNAHGSDDWTDFLPAIMTFQKTGLKPLKSYLTSFARSKNAAFQAITEVTLTMQKRGDNDYSVPSFKKVGETPEEAWREFSTQYRTMADFLRADPGARDEDEDGGVNVPSSNVAKPPAKAAKAEEPAKEEDIVDAEVVEEPEATPEPEKPAAKAEPEAAATEDDDDLPF